MTIHLTERPERRPLRAEHGRLHRWTPYPPSRAAGDPDRDLGGGRPRRLLRPARRVRWHRRSGRDDRGAFVDGAAVPTTSAVAAIVPASTVHPTTCDHGGDSRPRRAPDTARPGAASGKPPGRGSRRAHREDRHPGDRARFGPRPGDDPHRDRPRPGALAGHRHAGRARQRRRCRAPQPPGAPRSDISTSCDKGDQIRFSVGPRSAVYRVTDTFVVEPTEVWIAEQSRRAHRDVVRLPSGRLGGAADRRPRGAGAPAGAHGQSPERGEVPWPAHT